MSTPDTLNPERWLFESRVLSARTVYAPEVLRVIWDAQQSGSNQLEPMKLSEDYLKQAGRIAQWRAVSEALTNVATGE